MLVKLMTSKEAVNEIMNDLPRVRRKMHSQVTMLHKKLKRNKAESFYEVFDYVSPNRNTWFYSIRFDSKRDIKKGHCHVFAACWYVSTVGFRACVPSLSKNTPFIIFSGHLFDRYKERTNCEIENRLDLVKHYFKHNNTANFQVVDESLDLDEIDTEKGKCDMYRNSRKGIELGYADLEANCIIMNTFVSNNLLRRDQSKVKEHMDGCRVKEKVTGKSANAFLGEDGSEDKEIINNYRAVKKLESLGITYLEDIRAKDDYDKFESELDYLINILGEKRGKVLHRMMKKAKKS